MEVSIEASARLVNVPPVALLNFQIHKAYQMVSGPKDLWVEVVVKERFRGGEVLTEVRTSSKPGEYHTSALVLHRAEPIPLGRQLPMTLERPLLTVGQALYDKKRIRNGPIYQVLKDIAVTSDPVKGLGQANLVLQNPLGQGCYLPLTLLDGLLQLEAVTRTGYDETCGIPKSYQRILWDCEQTHSQTVIGQAEILGQRDNPQNWGYLSLAEQGRIILRVEGSTVTPGINAKAGGGK
jgi:hypothetical protein